MSGETSSYLMRCWPDPQTGMLQVQVVHVDTGEEVQLAGGSYLLRVSIDPRTSVVRCFLRHVASGEESYVQGNKKLQAFIKHHLLGK